MTWLNIQTEEIIFEPINIKNKPKQIWNPGNELILAAEHIYPATEIRDPYDERYHKIEITADYVNKTVTFKSVYLDLDVIKKRLHEALTTRLHEKSSGRPNVHVTELDCYVNGGRVDLENFKIGKKYNIPYIKDAFNNDIAVNNSDYDYIVSAIELYGLNMYRDKWGKGALIDSFTTVDECIGFENEPYDEEVDVLDNDGNPTGETETVTRYRNNAVDW